MRIRRARQLLKSLADDTRLRIVNILKKGELNVSELCRTLGTSQSNISKHLTRLRLTGIVNDKRRGLNVYYYLREPETKVHAELVRAITAGLRELEIFRKDALRLEDFKRKTKRLKAAGKRR